MSNYSPEPKTGSENLEEWLLREFRRISIAFDGVEEIQLIELNVEPSKPRSGMVVLADGTNFNPGSGRGFYGYTDGAWTFLG